MATFLTASLAGANSTAVTALTNASGGGWSLASGSSAGGLTVFISPPGTLLAFKVDAIAYPNGASEHGATGDVEYDFTWLFQSSAPDMGIFVRFDTTSTVSAPVGYMTRFVPGTGWQLYRVNGSPASGFEILTTVAGSYTDGLSYPFKISVAGTTDVIITLTVNSVQIYSFHDTLSNRIQTAGRIGIRTSSVGTLGSSNQGLLNLTGLDFAASPTFSLTTPVISSGSVVQDNTIGFEIDVAPAAGYTGTVTLSASGQPAGVTPSFFTNTVTLGSTQKDICYLAASGTATVGGPTTVTISGTDGTITSTTTFALTVTAVAVPAAPADASACTRSDGSDEVTWTPVATATSYEIWQSTTTLGGTYTLLATVGGRAGSIPLYVQASPPGTRFYKVFAKTFSGDSSTGTSAGAPAQYHSANLAGGTLVSQKQRHDLLVNSSGGYLTPTFDNIAFTSTGGTTQTVAFGPAGSVGIGSANFLTGTNGLTYTSAGFTGTQASANGVLNVAGTAGFAVYTTGYSPPAPCSFPRARILTASHIFAIGWGTTAKDGIWARYNGIFKTLEIYGCISGVETSLLAPFAYTPTGPFSLGIEMINNTLHLWNDTGSGWNPILDGSSHPYSIQLQSNYITGGAFDTRHPGVLSAYQVAMYCGATGSVASTTNIEEFVWGTASGVGGMREPSMVTNLDMSIYRRPDGLAIFGADRCGARGAITDVGRPVMFALSLCDLDQTIGGLSVPYVSKPFCYLTMQLPTGSGYLNGNIMTCQDCQLVYDHNLLGTHVFSCAFGNGIDGQTFADYNAVYFGYAFIPNATLDYYINMPGFLHLGVMSNVTLPAGMTFAYSPNMFMSNAVNSSNASSATYRYYMILTNSAAAGTFYTRVISGPSPSVMDTIHASDTGHTSEEVTPFFLGSKIYCIGGLSGTTNIPCWQFDITALTLTYLGNLTYSTLPVTGGETTNPPQPFPLPVYRDGQTHVYLLTGGDLYEYGQYATGGLLQIQPMTTTLVGQQAAHRTSIALPSGGSASINAGIRTGGSL